MNLLRISLLCLLLAGPACAQFTVGLNWPWYQEKGEHHYGRGFGDFTDARRATVEAQLAEMQRARITRLRIWLLADGWKYPERANGQFAPLSGAFLADLRWFLRRAHAHGILVQPSLWDFYLNRTHREYLTDTGVLPAVLERVIRPLAQVLASEPGCGVVDVMNEPEWAIRFASRDLSLKGREFNPGEPHDFAVLHRWIRGHVQVLKAAGCKVTVGSAGTQWVARWKGLGLDEYQVHYYPKPGATWIGNAMFRLLPSVSKLGLDRPCVLGEFPPNRRFTDIPTILGIVRDKGYAGAWAWEYFGDGYPEDLKHPFSFHAKMAEFAAFR